MNIYLAWGIIILLILIIAGLISYFKIGKKSVNVKPQEQVMSEFQYPILSNQPLPGLGESGVPDQPGKLMNGRKINGEELVILKTQLLCAYTIIPDVEFNEFDSIELMKLKQQAIRVRKILTEICGK